MNIKTITIIIISLLFIKTVGYTQSIQTLAEEKVKDILGKRSETQTFKLQSGNVEKASAKIINGERVILYNEAWMRQYIIKDTVFEALFILAHEIGHHVNKNTDFSAGFGEVSFGSILPPKPKEDFFLKCPCSEHSKDICLNAKDCIALRREELEADFYAANVLFSIGGDIKETKKAIEDEPDFEFDSCRKHPVKTERRMTVEIGWYDAAYCASKSTATQNMGSKKYSDAAINYKSAIEHLEKLFQLQKELKTSNKIEFKSQYDQRLETWKKEILVCKDGFIKATKLIDKDGDSVPDVEDLCPKQRGKLSNCGCPEYNFRNLKGKDAFLSYPVLLLAGGYILGKQGDKQYQTYLNNPQDVTIYQEANKKHTYGYFLVTGGYALLATSAVLTGLRLHRPHPDCNQKNVKKIGISIAPTQIGLSYRF